MVCCKFKFLINFEPLATVVVAQLVRASDCDSEGRGFEPHHPPKGKDSCSNAGFFLNVKRYLLKVNAIFFQNNRPYIIQNLC